MKGPVTDLFKHLKPAIAIEVAIHLLFWAFITIAPIFSRPYPGLPHQFPFSPWHFVLTNILLAVQFYLNAFWLIPVVLNKRKNIILYFTLMLAAFICIDVIMMIARPQMPFVLAGSHMPSPPFGAFNLLPLAAFTAAAFAYRYLADQFRAIGNRREITNAALLSELAFLRSQISPHFIFNVINSAVALSRVNPAAVEPTLISLSQLMRYMLYITDEEMVTLAQKENYLRSYIGLQELRFQKMVKVSFNCNIAAPEKTIEPMLLIPFVENAFKHGTGDIAGPAIDISLQTDNKTLAFSVQNRYDANSGSVGENHGIGLANVKRRLALLYPGRHSLVISQSENLYKINLQIQLK